MNTTPLLIEVLVATIAQVLVLFATVFTITLSVVLLVFVDTQVLVATVPEVLVLLAVFVDTQVFVPTIAQVFMLLVKLVLTITLSVVLLVFVDASIG